jgi:hypothetical protein
VVCPRCYHETYYHHRCPECGERLLVSLAPRMRRVLAREARINRRRARVVGLGIILGLASAPLMAEYNPYGLLGLAVHLGALAPLWLFLVGQLSPYEDSWHEFYETYVNAGHQYAWPAYMVYQATWGEGLTNFMVVELGIATCCALAALLTGGAFDIGCTLICCLAGIVSWFFSSCLKLHWY